MMAQTKEKGDKGCAIVMADVLRRGYKVAIPVGEDWPFDLIVLRQGTLERVQCKYVESDGCVVEAKCRSSNNWVDYKYTPEQIDWIAVYDQTTDCCYYLPSILLGTGRTLLSLRLTPPKNGQTKGIRYAKDFTDF